MGKKTGDVAPPNLVQQLIEHSFLFREMDDGWLRDRVSANQLVTEKLYSSRPIFTAFQPDVSLEFLYIVLSGGPVVVRSTPLDRVIAMTYAGGAFGMHSLPIGFGQINQAFPSLVEAYKTTDVVKVPSVCVQQLYDESETFRTRYNLLFELREKFQYHLLNCSTYPPQAVAALLRALVYQERLLGTQPNKDKTFSFDLPVDIIAHACQLNHRTVEQVLKGMTKEGILKAGRSSDPQGDILYVANPEALKSVYSSTRDKVGWWPLK
ncbi:MAG: Crp/Fnr family transcriptional regulator [Leptolyngbyaceae cyanobacterium]